MTFVRHIPLLCAFRIAPERRLPGANLQKRWTKNQWGRLAAIGVAVAVLFAHPAMADFVGPGTVIVNTNQGAGAQDAYNGVIVDLEPGGSIGSVSVQWGLELSDTSQLNMTGGSLTGSSAGLFADGNGSFSVSGGSISGTSGLNIEGSYNFTLSGGSFNGSNADPGLDMLQATDSTGALSGGTYSGREAIRAASNSTLSISGGQVDGEFFGLDTEGNATVNVTGGTYSGAVDAFYVQDNGVINIYGTGLQFSGGDIVGTLQDGQSIEDSYQIAGGQINLINATVTPEPNFMWLLGAVLLTLVGVRKGVHS
ncbi:MAG: hypothetical protein ABSD59_04665 [Terracidiphilus sp.]|jgi:hypothetical protein